MTRFVWSTLVLAFLSGNSLYGDWDQFRGPGGNATSHETNLPLQWSEKENIGWRVELPGLGGSSPIVVGNRVLVTCYSGYAESADSPGDMNKLMRHVVCIDRTSGKISWKIDVEPHLPESKYEGGNNTWHGYSSSTPASDGKHLYIFFGKTGVFCIDMQGKEVWQADVGVGINGWGSGTSPILHKNLLIVNAALESGSLIALDKATGKEKWRASGVRGSWSTPVLVPLASGKTELVLNAPQRILAFDPDSGEKLWQCDGIDDGYVCPSLVSHEGIVYAIGGRTNTALAVRAGGRDDVTDTHVLWRTNRGSNVSSPVYHAGYLYWVHEKQGVLNCLDAKTGDSVFQERIDPRPGTMYASLVAADGKLYCVSQHKGAYVFAAAPKYQLLAHNVIKNDDHRANASLAIQDGRIFMRNDKYLYCIGKDGRVTTIR